MQQTPNNIRIVPLADNTDKIAELVSLFVAEWEPYYGEHGPGNALEDLTASCNRRELPIALVALNGDGVAVGSATLKSDSVGSKPGQSPWLAALVVQPKNRRLGIGTLLVEAIEEKARRLGYVSLFISTDGGEGIVKRRGWLPLDIVSSLRGPIAVYRFDITPPTRPHTPGDPAT